MNKNFWTKILIALFILYILFAVGRVIYQSFKVSEEIEGLRQEIVELGKINQELSEKILYYQSPSYREKIARERLGLQKPDEEVMVILPEERPKITEESKEEKLPNYIKWWNYFFKGK